MAEDRKGKTLQRKRGENEKRCTQISIKEKRIHQTEYDYTSFLSFEVLAKIGA